MFKRITLYSFVTVLGLLLVLPESSHAGVLIRGVNRFGYRPQANRYSFGGAVRRFNARLSTAAGRSTFTSGGGINTLASNRYEGRMLQMISAEERYQQQLYNWKKQVAEKEFANAKRARQQKLQAEAQKKQQQLAQRGKGVSSPNNFFRGWGAGEKPPLATFSRQSPSTTEVSAKPTFWQRLKKAFFG